MRDSYVIERIEQLCDHKNMTHYRLAKNAGIHQSSLTVLLNRSSTPSIHTLNKICKGFDLSLSHFFSNERRDIDLTGSKNYIIDVWSKVEEYDRKLIMAYLDGIKAKNKF